MSLGSGVEHRVLVVDEERSVEEELRAALEAPTRTVNSLGHTPTLPPPSASSTSQDHRIAFPSRAVPGATPAVSLRAPAAMTVPTASTRRVDSSQPGRRRAFRVDSAPTADRALEMVKKAQRADAPYGLLLVNLRDQTGNESHPEDVAELTGLFHAIEQVLAVDPDLPIIVCGPDSTPEDSDAFVARLRDHAHMLFIEKPLESIEVVEAIHTTAALRSKHLELLKRLRFLEAQVEQQTVDLEERDRTLERETVERQRAEEQFRYLATHDPLTRLANRVLLNDRLRHSLEQARRYDHVVGVVFLDLDGFKAINAAHGHGVGDLLLQSVGSRLEQMMRRSDTVARIGGDEFAVVMERVGGTSEAEMVASRILQAVGAPFEIGGRRVVVTGSVGLSVFPNDAESAETLMKEAEAAMLAAQRGGGGRHVRGTNLWASSELNLRDELCRALERQSFRLVYQPVVSFETGEILSMEALIRWRHPTLGELPPLQFIRAAETSGLMSALGKWILDTACATYADWRARGIAPRAIAVNVSAEQLHHGDFAATVERILTRHALEPQSLEIELTETAASEDLATAAAAISRLAKLGVRIVIDDFGAGFSSLRRLKQFSVCALKIDRYFTESIASNDDDAAIVAAIIAMARSLGLEVVAEGIETMAQVGVLRKMATHGDRGVRCDRLQGYLIARPLPEAEALRVLAEGREGRGIEALVSRTADILASP